MRDPELADWRLVLRRLVLGYVADERAAAFWVLADPEGNEACICTWQDRG